MKKIILISMCCLTLYADVSLEERFEEAIRNSQAPLVNQLIRNLDLDALSKSQKKMLIADLSELAAGVAQSKKSRIGFFRNLKDCSAGFIGSLVALVSSVQFWLECSKLRALRKMSYTWPEVLLTENTPFLSVGVLYGTLSILGTYLAYKGLTCSAQKNEIAQAQAIGSILEDKKEELGL